jgi:hypothetical protein
MAMTIYVVLWSALALVVLGLAIYRNLQGIHEGTLHISGGAASLGKDQLKQFKREETTEHWGEWLTVVVALYGLVLAAIYIYQVAEHSSRMMR